MTGALWRSALVAALFGVHPLRVESVAWAAERKDVLSTFFWMLTMGAYVRYVALPSKKRYLAMIAFFALGLTAKPMLVTLPFVLLLLDYWPLNRLNSSPLPSGERGRDEGSKSWPLHPSPQPSPQRGEGAIQRLLSPAGKRRRREGLALIVEKLPLFALTLISSIVTFWVQHTGGTVSTLEQLSLSIRLESALVEYVGYLTKTIWPMRLAPFYPLYADHLPVWQVAGSAILVVGFTALAWALRCRCSYFLVGWLWYLGTLVPVIGLVQVGLQSSADRYTYVPLIGIFLAGVWGAGDLVALLRVPATVRAVTAAVGLAAFAALTELQVGYWRDTPTLWTHTIAVVPNSYVAYNNLGYYFARADDENTQAQAKEYFEKSLRINATFPDAQNNLGHTLAREGKLQEAIKYYSDALALNPRFAQVHNNLGLALARVGRVDEAADHFREAFTIRPTYSMAHNNLGKLLAQRGQTSEARAELEEALRLDPENADADANLGVLLQREGDGQGALELFLTAIRLDPKNADAHNNLGMLLASQGKVDLAEQQFSEAVKHNPRLASAQYNLGVALAQQGKREEAIAHYIEAVRLEPADAQARNNLGRELLWAGRWNEAATHLAELVRQRLILPWRTTISAPSSRFREKANKPCVIFKKRYVSNRRLRNSIPISLWRCWSADKFRRPAATSMRRFGEIHAGPSNSTRRLAHLQAIPSKGHETER